MPFHGSVTWSQMYSLIRDSEHLYTEVRGWVAVRGVIPVKEYFSLTGIRLINE